MLNWCIKKNGSYKLPLPPLSKDEEEVVREVSEEFKEFSKHSDFVDDKTRMDNIFDELLMNFCKKSNISLDKDQREYLKKYIYSNVIGFCGLELLLKDDEIEEISMIGVNKPVYIYKSGRGWLDTNLFFRKEETAIDVINKMARGLGRRVTYQSPKLNAILPDGSRLHASIPPISNIELTIRKFRSKPITVCDLIRFRTYSPEALAFLSVVFQSDYNLIVAGNTASGKTSTLNALFSFVPLTERILIIEETPEINIPHNHCIKMVSNADLLINMKSLVEDSLRMRPDRVIVGEVRTQEEIAALIETILSGQARGSYATFHAQSADEVIKRLLSLGVLQIDLSSIDFIVIQRRLLRYNKSTKAHWEDRKGIEIVEISGEKPDLIPLFSYNFRKDKLISSLVSSKKLDEIATAFSMSREELLNEIKERAQFLEHLTERNLDFNQVVAEIQKSFFGESSSTEEVKREQTRIKEIEEKKEEEQKEGRRILLPEPED